MKNATFLALACLTTATVATAQDDTSRSKPLAVQALRNFAFCAVERTPRGAVSLLEMDYRETAYAKALQRYAKGHAYCAPGGTLKFAGVIFAGGLAEALLRQRLESRSLSDMVAPVATGPAIEARGEGDVAALCTVRTAPGETQLLLKTEPGTDAERVALQSLVGTFTGCLRKGQEFTVNRPGLRAMLALAAYRLAGQAGERAE